MKTTRSKIIRQALLDEARRIDGQAKRLLARADIQGEEVGELIQRADELIRQNQDSAAEPLIEKASRLNRRCGALTSEAGVLNERIKKIVAEVNAMDGAP